ncbi:MAG: hypothetical protein ACHQZQ_03300 [SAR324 cluster bacterium]
MPSRLHLSAVFVAGLLLSAPVRLAGSLETAQAQPVAPAARAAAPEPPPRPPLPAEAKPLLDADVDTWMAGLDALRTNPSAREVLLQALANRPTSPRRWRLAYHLMAWGSPQDLPVVDELLDGAEGKERGTLISAMETLYPRPRVPVDLARVLTEFVFIPQDAPQRYGAQEAGRWLIDDRDLQDYQQEGLPIRVIERIMALRGRGFDSRAALADAMQKQIQGRLWADFGERLLAPVSSVPARLAQSGLLRMRLANPESRQLVIKATFQIWYGRFERTPTPLYVLLPPGQTVQREVDVRLIAPQEPGRPRVYLRIRESNVPGSIESQKLEVALRRQPG